MENCALLAGGDAAFGEILRRCALARRSIEINMFIWRDDGAGNALARALLDAADRGVRVRVVKDRFGGAFERAEERGGSFWNKKPDLLCASAALALRAAMPREERAPLIRQRPNALADALRRRPGVSLDAGHYRFDHTKYCIFDDETLILGGVNVEDKELGADVTGMHYHDLMVSVSSPEAVRRFRDRLALRAPFDPARPLDFIFSGWVDGRYRNGMLDGYLDFIGGARERLCVMMPYIGDRRAEAALLAAAARGAEVICVMPRRANLQNDYNYLAASRLRERSGGRIRIFLTPMMCHAKLMTADGARVTLGSANLNRDGLSRGWQLNCVSRDPALAEAAQRDFDAVLSGAEEAGELSFAPAAARLQELWAG